MRDRFGAYLLISPAMVVLAFTLAAPLALLVAYSFWSQQGLSVDTHPTWSQYAAIATRDVYRVLFLRSIAISSLATLLTILLAFPMAYFVAFRAGKSKFVWLLLLTIPFWTSYLLRVFAWKVILGYNGVINSSLIGLKLISQPLQILLYTPAAVVVTLTHAYAAFAILPIYVSLEKIDRSLLDAAADLGDGPVRRFFRVTLPLSLPGIIAAAVLVFIPATGDYVTPALVGGSDGLMVANIIQVQFGRADNWPLGAALAVGSLVLVAALAFFAVQAARFATARIR